jgi:hypothetical protein
MCVFGAAAGIGGIALLPALAWAPAAAAAADAEGWEAREAADRFFSSVMMKAHSFMKPKASPYREQVV